MRAIKTLLIGLTILSLCSIGIGQISTSPNGLSFIPQQIINVLDYQAKCDGSTNDLTALNNAVAAWNTARAAGGNPILLGPSGKVCKVTGPVNFTASTPAPQFGTVRDLYVYGNFVGSGSVGTLGTITGGSGGTNGTYTNVPLTGGSGSGCTAASVTVSGNAVTSVVLSTACGSGYKVADTLSASSANIGSTTGFSVPVASIGGGGVIDALGNKFIVWENVSIQGDCTNTPNVGLVIGRISNASADVHKISNIKFSGCFTLANQYNLAAETVQWDHPEFFNNNPSTTSTYYGIIQDGANHWNWSSTFVTETLAIDTGASFNENLFVQPDIRVTTGTAGIGIWVEKTSRHKYISGYLATNHYGVAIYTGGSGLQSIQSDYDIHIETTSATDGFFITGPYATPTMFSLSIKDHDPLYTNSVLKADTNITAVTLTNAEIKIGTNTTVKLFDNASLWTVSVNRIELPAAANWQQPGSPLTPGGSICLASTCTALVPTIPFTRNPDMVIDQANVGNSFNSNSSQVLLVDGWRQGAFGGPGANRVSFQQTTNSPPTGYNYSLSYSVTNPNNMASTLARFVYQAVEGSWGQAQGTGNLLWGTSAAIPISCEWYAKANNTGEYDMAVRNLATATRSYVQPYTISTANTWQYFTATIPGDTGGSWSFGPNVAGIFIVFTESAGSNFNTTSGAWQAGNYLNTTTAFNLENTTGGTFNITGIHCYPGSIVPPYQPRALSDELHLAWRYYAKSFPVQTQPAQNAGAGGAVTFLAPYAFATNATAGTYVPFPVSMFRNNHVTNPTMTFYSPNSASANCYDNTQSANAGAAAAVNLGDKGFLLTCTTVTGDALGDQLQVHWTADNGLL